MAGASAACPPARFWAFRLRAIRCLCCGMDDAGNGVDSKFGRPLCQGLPGRLPKLGVVATPLPGIQPVLVEVRLAEHSQRPEIYVNSQPVQWDDLEAVLRKQMSIRPPSWPVYLQGDANMDFGWAAKAIDIIRGAHAEVMLVAGH